MTQTQAPAASSLGTGLKPRHITMISIAGVIGAGLFVGSSSAIAEAGPGVLLSYALAGTLVVLVMRMLGEMAVEHPVSGSFAAYSRAFIGPVAGFITGWNWWFTTVVVGMLELTAMGTFLDYWFPGLPHWVTALVTLLVVVALHVAAALWHHVVLRDGVLRRMLPGRASAPEAR